MKKLVIPVALAILSGLMGADVLWSQETGGQDPMMQLMMKYGMPGEFHKKLDGLIGSWDLTTKWWMDPKAPPQESKGTAECSWIMGGRYVRENVTGDVMNQPFHGMSISGYNNFRQEFVSLWIDNMSTSFMFMTGAMDKDDKTIAYQGTYDDIMTGQKDKKFRVVTKSIDSDHRVYEWYDFAPDGKEFMSMEVSYTRKK